LASIASTFEKVAAAENAVFNQIDKKYLGEGGSYIHTSMYTLECNYRNVQIEMKNELGHQNMGMACCQFETKSKEFSFRIDTRSSLFQLFNRDKSALKISSENAFLQNAIEENKAFKALNRRAREDCFEPQIIAQNTNEKCKILCNYHLVFNNKELVVSPLIKLFKALVDIFLDGDNQSS